MVYSMEPTGDVWSHLLCYYYITTGGAVFLLSHFPLRLP